MLRDQQVGAGLQLGEIMAEGGILVLCLRPDVPTRREVIAEGQRGKVADFVVLRKNPLDDIANTRTLSVVYLAGKKFE